ncbi:hypothetical protein K438DRAFT_2025441 [Mycena galopus ATCC 62051]|nr:hypothetical protein K438DRAFT_2025441 [Mycena galopus ATCC 62051]
MYSVTIFANCKSLKAEALKNKAIVQHYINKARTLQPARRSSTPLLGDADDKHCLCAVPPTPADVLDHPLYMFSVPPKMELLFISHILNYPGIEHAVPSAFTRAIGSGAINTPTLCGIVRSCRRSTPSMHGSTSFSPRLQSTTSVTGAASPAPALVRTRLFRSLSDLM